MSYSENLGVFWVLLAEKDFDQLDNLDNIAPHNHPRNNPEKFGMDNNHNNHIDDCKAIDNSNQIPDL